MIKPSTHKVDYQKANEWRLIMSITSQSKQQTNVINGVDAEAIMEMAGNIQQNEEFGQFIFRAHNEWIDGAHSCSIIQGFFAGGEEHTGREQALTVNADQPAYLGGKNIAPNPVEHYLHALDSCLNVTLVYHAAVQGIPLECVEVSSEGEMNARGFFGISEDVHKGFERIRVELKVKSDADEETLTKLAMYSPVYEMVSKAIPVEFNLTKI
jgi:uncharacterized OsmC-like protein